MGQRWDATIGLYFYNARYYDPLLGRFVQPDTLVPEPGKPQALNRYSYGMNNPLRFADPTGHNGCDTLDPESDCDPGEPPWWAYLLTTPFRPEPSNPLAGLCIGNYCWTNQEYYQELLDYYALSAPQWAATLSDVALVFDTGAFWISEVEAIAADTLAIVLVGGMTAIFGPAGGEVGLGMAWQADQAIATSSPVAMVENGLGLLSLLATALSDIVAGNTGPTSVGLTVGQDTLIAFRNTVAGMVPESNLDFLVSASQLKYDLERRNGYKEGRAIPITQVWEIVHLILAEHW